MRASILFTGILATAALARPITEVAGNALDRVSLGKRGLDTITGDHTPGLKAREAVTNAGPADLNRRLLGLDGLVGTVNDLLTDSLSLVSSIENSLSSIVSDVEKVDVEGVLSDVEGLVSQLVSKVQDIVSSTGVDLDLSELNPTVAIVSNEVGCIVSTVQSLLDSGIVGEVIDEIKSDLETVTSLLSGLSL